MFSWRTGRRLLIGCAAFITLICIVYLVENIHGKRTWEKFRAKMIAAGEPLDPKELLPDPVPDDQNFAMTPLLDYEYHNGSRDRPPRFRDLGNAGSGERSGSQETTG